MSERGLWLATLASACESISPDVDRLGCNACCRILDCANTPFEMRVLEWGHWRLAVRSLPEWKKHASLKLIGHLAEETDQTLCVRVKSLRDLAPAERLVALVEYSARFAS
jgi:hypothetical protein